MSIDSIHRERWVEADMGNKIKLNHWIQGCRTMHRIQDEKERTKYRIIRKRGYLRMIHRTFRDWKVLALLKFKSNKARLRRVFFSLWIPHEFYSRLLGVLKYRQRLTLKSRLHQWKKNIDNSKLMKIRARRSAFLYLQRAGRVAILGQRILLRWLHHNLAQRFFRWKYNTRALKSMEQQVSERRDFLVMYECLRSWLRVRSRRLAISLLFQRCTLHFLMAGFYAIRRTTKPVVEVVPAQSPPPKSPVPPPPVLVVSTEGEEYSMDNDEEEEEEAQDEEPEVDVSQNAVNISALSANTDHSMKLEKCNCIKNLLKGLHCHCLHTTHVRLRLQACREVVESAIDTRRHAKQVMNASREAKQPPVLKQPQQLKSQSQHRAGPLPPSGQSVSSRDRDRDRDKGANAVRRSTASQSSVRSSISSKHTASSTSRNLNTFK